MLLINSGNTASGHFVACLTFEENAKPGTAIFEKGGCLHLLPPPKCSSLTCACTSSPRKYKHSKQPIKVNNNKASINGNGRKVVMNVLHPGSKGSIYSNAAVQLYMKPRVVVNTPKKQNGGGAAMNGDRKPLQKTVKND